MERIPSAVLPLIELITRFLSSTKRCIRMESPSMSDHFRSFIRISMRYPPMCMIKSLCLYYTISAQIMKDISVRKKRSFFYTVSTCVYCQSSVHYKYNIFFIQSGEMRIELWIYKDFYKISERGTTGAQHPLDVSGSEPCYHQGNFYW